ncbi:MAG: hypothetical protein CMP28_10350 [Roseibacillus sp.]|nr:hypothetical protein [Roseibacillus sp.]
MSGRIREIKGRKGLREFVGFPFDLYQGNEFWVPPLVRGEVQLLNPASNPAFKFLHGRYWVVEGPEGHIQGRIAAYIPRSGGRDRPARFGHLDFIDDPEVTHLLLGQVEQWAREEGFSSVEGPVGVTSFDSSALLVEGFDRLPTVASSYNFPYYREHLEGLQYEKEIDYIEFEIPDLGEVNARVEKLAAYTLRKKGIRLLELKGRRELRRLAPAVFDVINEAYRHLHDFEPLTREQVSFYTDQYFAYLDPSLIKVLVDGDGEVAAVGISMPSLSRGLQAARGKLLPFGILKLMSRVRQTDTLDLYLVAVRKKWQKAGLPSILMHETHKSMLARGMTRAETNGELETNEAVQALWRSYGARQHKRRRIYRKTL